MNDISHAVADADPGLFLRYELRHESLLACDTAA